MSTIRRGSIVQNGRAIGVVWENRPDSVVLFPIRPGTPRRRSDVAIEYLPDRIACQLPGDAIVCVGRPIVSTGQTWIGELSGPAMCLVVQAVVRLTVEARTEAKWEGDRRLGKHRVTEKSAV